MIPWVVKIFGRRPRTNDCSSSSCPKEAVVRINEIDSARNMKRIEVFYLFTETNNSRLRDT